ncbi:hypothetical protein, partial [Campylobacter sp. RM12176]|nr:hypothetical protein [Campylobacter sp. RM12176]
MKNFPLPQKHCFAAFNPFVRMPVIDIRYINEGDIVYFTNYPHDEFKPEKCLELFIIMIDYKLHRDFFLQRRDFIHGYNSSLEAKLKIEQDKLSKTNLQLNIKNQELTKANTELKHLKDTINSISIKKQSLEISNLEQDLINKKLKAQILEKELGYDCNAIQENKELKKKIKILQLTSKE